LVPTVAGNATTCGLPRRLYLGLSAHADAPDLGKRMKDSENLLSAMGHL